MAVASREQTVLGYPPPQEHHQESYQTSPEKKVLPPQFEAPQRVTALSLRPFSVLELVTVSRRLPLSAVSPLVVSSLLPFLVLLSVPLLVLLEQSPQDPNHLDHQQAQR